MGKAKPRAGISTLAGMVGMSFPPCKAERSCQSRGLGGSQGSVTLIQVVTLCLSLQQLCARTMATDWLGSIVSINCGESLGVYQGRVSAVDQVSQTISLTRPFHNGVKCLVPEVTFR